jgi:hypothetical protein
MSHPPDPALATMMIDRDLFFARAAAAVTLATTAHIGAHPFDLSIHTPFELLCLDDADINDIAEAAAIAKHVTLAMPVACETLGDLAQLLAHAMEKL